MNELFNPAGVKPRGGSPGLVVTEAIKVMMDAFHQDTAQVTPGYAAGGASKTPAHQTRRPLWAEVGFAANESSIIWGLPRDSHVGMVVEKLSLGNLADIDLNPI